MDWKVGDKVRIKCLSGLKEANKLPNSPSLVSDMQKYASKEAKITNTYGVTHNWYAIDIDCGAWKWSEEMFEPKDIKKAFPTGTKVVPMEKTAVGLVEHDIKNETNWSKALQKNQPYLFVNGYGYDMAKNVVLQLGYVNASYTGNYYFPGDVKVYNEPKPMQPKKVDPSTFKVGDTVILRHDYIIGKTYANVTLLSGDMTQLVQKPVVIKSIHGDGTCSFEHNLYTYSLSMFELISSANNKESKEDDVPMLKYNEKVSVLLNTLKNGQNLYSKNGVEGWFKFGCVVERNEQKYVITGFKGTEDGRLTALNMIPFTVSGSELVVGAPKTIEAKDFDEFEQLDRYGYEYLINEINNPSEPVSTKKTILLSQIADAEKKLAEMKSEVSTM